MDVGIRRSSPSSKRNRTHSKSDRRHVRVHRRRGSLLILDTNALSAFVDGDTTVGEMLRQQARACIPVIVLGEFRYGIAQSRHRPTYELWLKTNLHHFDVLSITA